MNIRKNGAHRVVAWVVVAAAILPSTKSLADNPVVQTRRFFWIDDYLRGQIGKMAANHP
jgi:hypothetical protein